jgi:hypothetical protein
VWVGVIVQDDAHIGAIAVTDLAMPDWDRLSVAVHAVKAASPADAIRALLDTVYQTGERGQPSGDLAGAVGIFLSAIGPVARG